MNDKKDTPKQKRERIRQEELQRNPTGNMNDTFNKASYGGLADLVGSLGWKGTGILIVIFIIIGFIITLFIK
ncbi:DUF6366 family protein [Sutcliffiella cohnii]|uniref:DUF6366 family protein n=1 Tax=Sutcliffiella cohnii TaxID=33932 RepID=UPI002E1C91D3|nr:DUF6366 family protein [Sutcliffiella cohnii]